MLAIASLLIIITLSLLIIRVGTIALTMTGLSAEIASFQALSAFSGVGFTTDESEKVVTAPARRRVVSLLMLLGSLGVITAVSSLILSFVGAGREAPGRLLVLVAGVLALAVLARSRVFNRMLTPLIERALHRHTTWDLRDYADLLKLGEDHRVVEINVEPDSWLARARLVDLDLMAEGITVLGITRRDGRYIGAPSAEHRLEPGDQIILYGRAHRLHELAMRSSGAEQAHEDAKAEHRRELATQPDED